MNRTLRLFARQRVHRSICCARCRHFKYVCVRSPGGNPRGVFGLALVQGEWKVYVSGLLDREQQDWYLLNITASDGLYVARTAVEVTIMDANDNSPICNQVRDTDQRGRANQAQQTEVELFVFVILR